MSKTFLFLKARNKKEKFIQKCLFNIKTYFVLSCIVLGVGLSGAVVNAQEISPDTLAGVFIGRASKPVVISPRVGEVVKESIIEIAGEGDNDTIVNIYVDDVLDGTAPIKNGEGLKGTFLARLNVPLSLGAHVIYAIAHSTDKLASEKSEEVIITYNPNAIVQPPAPEITAPPVEPVTPGTNETASQPTQLPLVRVTAPTLRAPEWNTIVKAVRPVIDGVGRNGQTVALYIDDKLDGTLSLGAHTSGAVGFAYHARQKLSSGWHEVYAYSFNADSVKSVKSRYLRFYLELPFIAPTLLSARQTEKSAQVGGLAVNGSVITVFVDGKEDGQKANIEPHPSGVTSFVYTLSALPAPGRHTITAKAHDANGKESLLSNTIVLSALALSVEGDETAESEKQEDDQIAKAEPAQDAQEDNTTDVKTPKEDTAPAKTGEPVKSEEEAKKALDEAKAEEEKEQEDKTKQESEKDVDEVVSDEASEDVKEEDGESASAETEKVVNWSLVVGVVILIGLIIAFIVWYVLQRRDRVNAGIKRLFGEEEADEWSEDEESSFGEFAGDGEKAEVREALHGKEKQNGKEEPSKKEASREESKASEKKDKESTPASASAGKDEPVKKNEDRVKDSNDMNLPPPPPDL